LKLEFSKGSSKLCDVNLENVDLDTPNCLMAKLSLASSSIDALGVGDLDEASMPRFSHAASYHQSGELGAIPLEDVDGEDYLLD
jgi:hypothetical protein